MKAQRIKDRHGDYATGYFCDQCEETFQGDYGTYEASKIDDTCEVGYQTYAYDTNIESGFELYQCDNGCVTNEEFSMDELWQCGECEGLHTEKDRAMDCCS